MVILHVKSQLTSVSGKFTNFHNCYIYQCANGYTLSELVGYLEIEHKNQGNMELSGCAMDSYLKEKPVLNPALSDVNPHQANRVQI